MCLSSNAPKPMRPKPVPPPEAPPPVELGSARRAKETSRKPRGTSALRIDVQVPGGGGSAVQTGGV